jgi:hypothetical protein
MFKEIPMSHFHACLSACRSYLLIPTLADSTPTINNDDADNQHDIITSASEHLSSRGDKTESSCTPNDPKPS